jgi:biotin transport system substrate-specific component
LDDAKVAAVETDVIFQERPLMRETIRANRQTLAQALWPSNAAGVARFAALAFAGSLLLTISAKAQVPFWPVPMTMQTAVVIALGAAFGLRLGVATVALYLAEGLLGAPVFAGLGAGPAYMAGPTGGYLVGFLAAAMLVGALAERGWDRSGLRLVTAMTIGHAVIFAFGFAWMAYLFGAQKAFALGVAPFWLATILKTGLAAAVVAAGWKLVERIRA